MSAKPSVVQTHHLVEQAIELETPTGTIKGTLTTGGGSFKSLVVLLIAGSGPTDRDGNTVGFTGKNNHLKLLAAGLGAMGIASVRYDKRGVSESSKAIRIESDLRIVDYVQDAVFWIAKLGNDPRFSSVAVIGHSEGSLIGMLAAQSSDVTAFVSIAGAADKAANVLRRQLHGKLSPDLLRFNEKILTSLEAGRIVRDVPREFLALYRPSVQPYLISWFKLSPTKEIAKLQMPCLIVQGGTDIQVNIADADALNANSKNCSLKLIAGMNHILKTVPNNMDGQIASYSDPTLPIDSELMHTLTEFLSIK